MQIKSFLSLMIGLLILNLSLFGQVTSDINLQLNSNDKPFTMRLSEGNIIFGFRPASDTLLVSLPNAANSTELVLAVFPVDHNESFFNVRGHESGSGVTFSFPLVDFAKSIGELEDTNQSQIFQLRLGYWPLEQNVLRFEVLR